jgi:DNA-binding NarL/FixJ family response regulator
VVDAQPTRTHEAPSAIRLLLVDDSTTMRTFLSRILDGRAGISVVGECADGSEVSAKAAEVVPDVVVMDLSMPVMSGIEAIRVLLNAQPAVRILMLSASQNPEDHLHAAEAGAVGFVSKDGDFGALVSAIHTVAAGGTVWSATKVTRR